MKKQKILIVGGGFGGVKAALGLVDDPRFEVTLVSDMPDLRYYPTLYHTATGGKNANSSIPLARIFYGKEITLAHGTATTIDRKFKVVSTEQGQSYSYDSVVLALGVVTNFFGIPGMKEYAYSIKTQSEVARFKAHLHQQLIQEEKLDAHYVIVGAGPTGIELAGALPAYLREIASSHGLRTAKPHVDLIEAAPRLLPRFPKDMSRAVKRRLKRLGVKLYLGSAVQATSAEELTVNGKPIRSHSVIWTAGVTNHPFFTANNFVLMARGKVAVDTFLQTEENIFVVGDNANTPYSGLAQTAIHDGATVAANIRRKASGKNMKSYVAKAPISVIPAGNKWAAVQWGKITISGYMGWVLREAADFIGFKDIEPLDRATKQFMTEFERDDACKVCIAAGSPAF
ncbi:MAG: FAD-dependent oxidoreductase [Patescibacteria group bacterium]|nr:FAD-dependent oxidoreductase [Patescibacteria group bacterium]